MQRATLSIPVGTFGPDAAYSVYGDADAAGRPSGTVDYTRPISGPTPVPFWPLIPSLPGWLEGRWPPEGWQSIPGGTQADHSVKTPLLYFGKFLFSVRTFDRLGNASGPSGDPITVFVNSGPEPVTRLRQSGTAGGTPVFTWTPPAQFR